MSPSKKFSPFSKITKITSFLGLLLAGTAPSIVPSIANADLVFFPGLGYTTQTVKSNGSTTVDTKLISADGRLGYLSMSSGLYIGGMYKYESGSGGGTDNKSTVKAASPGASVGFMLGGLSLIGTYFMQGTREVTTSGVVTKYKSGTGFQVDAAFMAAMSESFYVGPQISYRSIKYTESTTAGVTNSSEKYQLDTIQPTLAFLIKF